MKGPRTGDFAGRLCVFLVLACATPFLSADPPPVYLGDPGIVSTLRHHQQWGELGLNTAAAARTGTKGSPLRIGSEIYARGLGHHAQGEILVPLQGGYESFHALIGVQWQGGGRGSVLFKVLVDGRTAFEGGPMSDSDPARAISISVAGASELRLVAGDGGDGIGCDMANWAEARLISDGSHLLIGDAELAGPDGPPSWLSAEVAGFKLAAWKAGPQVGLMESAGLAVAGVEGEERVDLVIPIHNARALQRVRADAMNLHGDEAQVTLAVGTESVQRRLAPGETWHVEVAVAPEVAEPLVLTLGTRGLGGEAGVRWGGLRGMIGDRSVVIPWRTAKSDQPLPPPVLPDLRPSLEKALIEWDWRMQDGVGAGRLPRTFDQAIKKLHENGDQLRQDLIENGVHLGDIGLAWKEAVREWMQSPPDRETNDLAREAIWRRLHTLRRGMALLNPLAQTGPLVFAKRVPSNFSHQLTQYYGMCARPGGGIFLLENPGTSMRVRSLANLPPGSSQHPEVTWDGQRILFSYCPVETVPTDREEKPDRHYHIYEMATDGTGLRPLTEGPYDDFSPRELPDGRILFLSTRRGGYHRCGRGPCPVYTLAVAEADGSNPRVISHHETHEWDPAVLNDGRVVYTRWDYVDRHAVHYQQLWTVRPDGSDVRILYGNNTLNPVGVWEARPVPGSSRIMATAGAHHAMTAGSIILLDVRRGADDLDPIQRLTPDVLFPESEFPVGPWHAPAGVPEPPPVPEEEQRWPGHCYRTPYPLSEDYLLAAYSFDPLRGEPEANLPNMFGLYLVDRFGNKELLYRDLNISSLWPLPLRARPRPPVLAPTAPATDTPMTPAEGTFFVQNVQESWPPLPEGESNRIRRLRILQVLPKTTPHSNDPKVGLANASPGKQVLGTVPVETDGSAYFRAPAGVPLSFQALDENGMAVQTMRSLTYLQPGEQSVCIGCHERRETLPIPAAPALARQRPPSAITPAPDGSRPFSYPLLVQPVLDRHCVPCHSEETPGGGVALNGRPAGHFSVSYQVLAPLVAYAEWRATPEANGEPLTRPNQFGARASQLTTLIRTGHGQVNLSGEDWERLVTWMDANALFYGTFDPADQRLQQLGQRIEGPALE